MSAAFQFPVIMRALKCHRLLSVLLFTQVAVTCAVVTNVVFLIAGRVHLMNQPSGIDESHLAVIESERVMSPGASIAPAIRGDLEALRYIPGVTRVAVVDALPFGHNDWINGFTSDVVNQGDTRLPMEVEPSLINGSQDALDVLGVRVVRGAQFAPQDFLPLEASSDNAGLQKVRVAIVTEAFAQRMFPGADALGRPIYVDGHSPVRIIGIADHVARPNLTVSDDNELIVFLPLVPDNAKALYIMRVDGDARSVIEAARHALLRVTNQRIFHRMESFTDLRADYFRRDAAMISILLAIAVALVFVNAVGIMGLASFWVHRRTRQTGVRRALGATRLSVLTYFLQENLVVVGGGALLGVVLALALNRTLMAWFEVPHLFLSCLPVAWFAMILIGQLAAFVPALRASSVDPSAAIRG